MHWLEDKTIFRFASFFLWHANSVSLSLCFHCLSTLLFDRIASNSNNKRGHFGDLQVCERNWRGCCYWHVCVCMLCFLVAFTHSEQSPQNPSVVGYRCPPLDSLSPGVYRFTISMS